MNQQTMLSHKIIVQSNEIPKQIPEMLPLPLKETDSAKQHLHCLNQSNQISHWIKSQDKKLNTQIDFQTNIEKQQILKSINFGIQQHMKKLNISNKLGCQFLSQSMNVVENNVTEVFKHLKDLKNRQSQLLLEIDLLASKLQYSKESQLNNTKKDSTCQSLETDRSNITTETSNSPCLISKLTIQNKQLNTQLEHLNAMMINDKKRIDQLSIKISSQNVLLDSLQSKINQLLNQQQQYKSKIEGLLVKLNESESQANNFDAQKNKMKTKINRLSSDIAAISLQLTKEKTQRLDLQNKLENSKQRDQLVTDEKTKALSLELFETKKKMQHMIKKTTFYQNKIIDLELEKEDLNTQLITLKSNIEDKLLKSRQSKLEKSRNLQKSSNLQKSRNLQQNKTSSPNLMVDLFMKQNIKQVEQKQIVVQLQSQTSFKKPNRSRIFGDVKKMVSLSTQNSSINNNQQ